MSEKSLLRILLRCMEHHPEEPASKVPQLKTELGEYHQTGYFDECANMGDIVEKHIEFMLAKYIAG